MENIHHRCSSNPTTTTNTTTQRRVSFGNVETIMFHVVPPSHDGQSTHRSQGREQEQARVASLKRRSSNKSSSSSLNLKPSSNVHKYYQKSNSVSNSTSTSSSWILKMDNTVDHPSICKKRNNRNSKFRYPWHRDNDTEESRFHRFVIAEKLKVLCIGGRHNTTTYSNSSAISTTDIQKSTAGKSVAAKSA